MLRFRDVAGRAAAENKIRDLRSLPGFWEWFDDWTGPHSWLDVFQTANEARKPDTLSAPKPGNCGNHDVAETETEPIEWSEPKSPTEWSKIFDVHYNTMIAWLKNQTVRNQKVTDRRYRVATFELP